MMNWNKKTSSVVIMCVHALRIQEAIDPPLLEEEVSYIPDRDASIEAELADVVNARPALLDLL